MIKIIFRISIVLCFFIQPISCTLQTRDDPSLTNFKKTGFLNDNFYQVIIKKTPDKYLKGLVERRENAYVKAEQSIEDTVLHSLINYNMTYNKMNLNHTPDILKNHRSQFKKYISYGFISDVYYDENDSAIIIYRINKTGLKSEIESFSLR